jgi:hypothetical protein
MVGGCGIDRGTGWNIGRQSLDFEGFDNSVPALFERLDRLPQFPPLPVADLVRLSEPARRRYGDFQLALNRLFSSSSLATRVT